MGTVRFEHDAANDIHLAYPDWTIHTENDCKIWLAQYEAYFNTLSGKVDVIFVLNKFKIGPGIGPIWGRYRSEMVSRFTRCSVRVHADAKVSTFAATSGAIHGASADEARGVVEAVRLIYEQRRHLDDEIPGAHT